MKEQYQKSMKVIQERSSAMAEAVILPMIDESTGGLIAESATCCERLEKVTKHTIFESAGKGAATIQGVAANAVSIYRNTYGRFPSPDLLASAHMAIENLLLPPDNMPGLAAAILESSGLSTTEGVMMRDRMVALVLPVLLQSITSRMVTHIPGTFNQSEIFKVKRTAGSTFGDLTTGDVIGYDFNGQYSSMDQRYLTDTGDGTEVGGADSTTANYFQFSAATDIGEAQPIKPKRVKILHDRDLVAVDDGEGSLHGTFYVGATLVTVTGSVTYSTGVVTPVFSTAPADGVEVHVCVDIDIETDPTLIPVIDHTMLSKVVYPHEMAINVWSSIQALWAMKREFNLNMEGMAMTGIRNFVAAERDRKILNDMRFYAQGTKQWDIDVPSGLTVGQHYETLRLALLEMDAEIMNRTGIAGLSGVVFDSDSASIVKYLPAPFFTPAPGYVRQAQPHYIGRMYGMWDAYEDPTATSMHSLAYGIGTSVGEAGYVVGDCIPPIPFTHPVQKDLQKSSTLWGLGYRDIHPFDGRNYFMELEFTTG